jgi:hypothetical protein
MATNITRPTRVHRPHNRKDIKKSVQQFQIYTGRKLTASESNALNYFSHPMRREKAV